MEVFSHSQYLNNKNAGVVEILPATGSASGGTRVAVLGYNFVESDNLRVKFGDAIVSCQFHDNCTLLCETPPLSEAKSVANVYALLCSLDPAKTTSNVIPSTDNRLHLGMFALLRYWIFLPVTTAIYLRGLCIIERHSYCTVYRFLLNCNISECHVSAVLKTPRAAFSCPLLTFG